jgi:glutathione S-transferase
MLQLVVESDARALKSRVAAAAAGVSLSVSVVPVASASAHAAVAASPFRQLPVLSTSDGPVSRSAPILRYIASLACDSGLMGRGYDALYSEASVDAWLEFSQLALEPLVAALSPAAAQLLDAASLAGARAMAVARLPPTLAALDAALQTRTFLAGERLTIADVTIACALAGVWETDGVDTAAWSHLTRWYFTCRHTPAFLSVMGVPGSSASASAGAAAAAPRGFSAIDALDAVGRSALVPTASSTAFSGRFVRQRARIADLLASGEAAIGRTIVVCGWLKNSREGAAGSLLFAAINDGSCFDNVQVVSERGKTDGFEALGKCGGTGSSIRVEGTVVKSQGKGQVIEVFASAVKVLGTVTEPEVRCVLLAC